MEKEYIDGLSQKYTGKLIKSIKSLKNHITYYPTFCDLFIKTVEGKYQKSNVKINPPKQMKNGKIIYPSYYWRVSDSFGEYISLRLSNHTPTISSFFNNTPQMFLSEQQYGNICLLVMSLNDLSNGRTTFRDMTIKVNDLKWFDEYKNRYNGKRLQYTSYLFVTDRITSNDDIISIGNAAIKYLDNKGKEEFKAPALENNAYIGTPIRSYISFVFDESKTDNNVDTTNESLSTYSNTYRVYIGKATFINENKEIYGSCEVIMDVLEYPVILNDYFRELSIFSIPPQYKNKHKWKVDSPFVRDEIILSPSTEEEKTEIIKKLKNESLIFEDVSATNEIIINIENSVNESKLLTILINDFDMSLRELENILELSSDEHITTFIE